MKIDRLHVAIVLMSLGAATGEVRAEEAAPPYTESDIRGTWTYAGWAQGTFLIPIPAEITHATPPSALVSRGDKVSLPGTLVGLFEFDGHGTVTSFRDHFKPGGAEPLPPFPLPFVPPSAEQGHGTYTVDSNGMVELATLIINPDTGLANAEADYLCVLNRSPRQLDCMFSRFKTYAVEPAGFHAPIVGQVVLRPQR